MANDVTKANFTLAEGKPHLLVVDGVTHELINGEFVHNGVALEGEKLTQAITKAFEHASKADSLSAHEFETLADLAATHKGTSLLGSEAGAKAVKFIEDAADVRKAFSTKNKNAIGQHLVSGGESVKYIPAAEKRAFYDELGTKGLKEFEKQVDAAKALTEKLKNAKFEGKTTSEAQRSLRGLLSAHHTSETDIKAIKGFLPTSLDGELSRHGFGTLEHEIAQFSADSAAAKDFLKDAAAERVQLVDDLAIAGKKWRGREAAVELAQNALDAHDKRILEFVAEDAAHGNAYNNLAKSVKQTLDSSTKIKSGIGEALKGVETSASVKDAAKSASTWKWTKTAGELEALGNPKGIGAALWTKRGGLGKAGVVAGAAAVTYAIVSAIGGKGPGDKAAAVDQERQNLDPAMAR